MEPPVLITFDIFGTVLNWYDGMKGSFLNKRLKLNREMFGRIIDFQGIAEQSVFRKYTDISTDSLMKVAGMNPTDAAEISRNLGLWPLFPDSKDAIATMMKHCDCIAMSNSDLIHAEQVQRQLGFKMSHWYSSEEFRVYKPNPSFWRKVSERQGISFSKRWWHVSAYADYDLGVAKSLGLTCVFVERRHMRPGPSDMQVKSLQELATVVAVSNKR